MLENRLREYWIAVREYRLATPNQKSGIFHGRLPNIVKHSTNPWTKKLLPRFIEQEKARHKVAAAAINAEN